MEGSRLEPLVSIDGVSFRYRASSRRAISDLNLEIGLGVIVGLVGPNGSGKTTLFRLILGLIRPTSGRITIAAAKPAAYRVSRGIGYLSESVSLPPRAKVRELAEFVSRLSGVSGRDDIAEISRELELSDRLDRRIATLSHGYRQRAGLLLALLGKPRLLLLDEPANGLDPNSLGVLRSQLRRQRRLGVTVIVSSHNLIEVGRVCDEVILLHGGTFVGRSTRDDLSRRSDVFVVQLGASEPDHQSVARALSEYDGVRLAADEFAFDDESRARRFASIVRDVELVERREFDLEYLFHSLLQERAGLEAI